MSSRVSPAIESRRIDLDVGIASESAREIGVRYLASGESNGKPPVVLCHGIGLDAAAVSWKLALPALAADRRVLALDLPGHGESDKPTRSYTSANYGAVLEAFFDALDIDRAALVGLSMGGAVALDHALSHPERVAQLVLVDSYGLGRDAPWRLPGFAALWTPWYDTLLETTLRDPITVATSVSAMTIDPDPEFVADVRRSVTDPATIGALTSWQRSEFGACGLQTCYLDRLDELSMPTLFVHGRDDPIFPVTWSERASERTEGSTFHAIERCGHWPPREHPELFNRMVRNFLAGGGPTGA